MPRRAIQRPQGALSRARGSAPSPERVRASSGLLWPLRAIRSPAPGASARRQFFAISAAGYARLSLRESKSSTPRNPTISRFARVNPVTQGNYRKSINAGLERPEKGMHAPPHRAMCSPGYGADAPTGSPRQLTLPGLRTAWHSETSRTNLLQQGLA